MSHMDKQCQNRGNFVLQSLELIPEKILEEGICAFPPVQY